MRFAEKFSTLSYSDPSPYTLNDAYMHFVDCHSNLGVCTNSFLNFHELVRRSVAIVGKLTTNLLSCTVCRDPDFLVHISVHYPCQA